ncbi:MAG: hypothetical protein PUG48_09050 [Clostridia bacterium]|nr:hypothetical protein [Clostridia bacterium]
MENKNLPESNLPTTDKNVSVTEKPLSDNDVKQNDGFYSGRILELDGILSIEGVSSVYLLLGKSKQKCTIDFGRRRKLDIPEDSYIVWLYADKHYEIEPIVTNEDKYCNYITVLKNKGISYSTPSKLPDTSIRRHGYSALQVSIGWYYSSDILGYFGTNGYVMITETYCDYVCKQTYIRLSMNPDALYLDGSPIIQIDMPGAPDTRSEIWNKVVKKLLMEKNSIDDGKKFDILLKKIGLSDDSIRNMFLQVAGSKDIYML